MNIVNDGNDISNGKKNKVGINLAVVIVALSINVSRCRKMYQFNPKHLNPNQSLH